MFKTLQDVKMYITNTIAKWADKFEASDYTIEYSNRLRRALAQTGVRYFCGVPMKIRFVFNNKYLASFKDNEEAIKDTVLHEIAHAIAGAHHHHDRVWKSQCIVVGCKPSRCKTVKY